MNITGNTILITGGGTGIGRGLAEAFHALGNKVIIAGRRQQALGETADANPGMASVTLDVADPSDIRAFAAQVTTYHPELNVLINNAGMMKQEDFNAPPESSDIAEATVRTNLLGPIHLTAALLPHFRKQPHSTIINVSSGLAFVPLPLTPTYCATKAALHSYTQSLRAQLQGSAVEVLELIPPGVQTDLMPHAAADPRMMPLKDFISETMQILKTQPTPPEICVEQVKFLRLAEANGSYDMVLKALSEFTL